MQLVGHSSIVTQLQQWKADNCKNPKYYILAGTSGIGKRSIIKKVFKEYEIVSFHSEYKKKDILEEIKKRNVGITIICDHLFILLTFLGWHCYCSIMYVC